jgi:HEAT repeat protein
MKITNYKLTPYILTLLLSYVLTFFHSYALPQQDPADCKAAIEAIDQYIEFLKCVAENPIEECVDSQTSQLSMLSDCDEAYDYIKSLIQQETSEQLRCGLIRYLGWMGNTESVTFLKQLLKKEELSGNEKYNILFALCQVGKHSERRDIMEDAVRLVDEFCNRQNGLNVDCTNSDCSQFYYFIGGETALDFFTYCFENKETRLQAALKLALLGEHEKTFSVFAEAIYSENTDDILIALQGLNAIGTEEAYLLMKSQTQNDDIAVALTAQKFCMNYEKKGGKL